MHVLGIDVGEGLLDQWRSWFAPPQQPFRVDRLEPGLRDELLDLGDHRQGSAEHRDTFFMYGGLWVWLDEARFRQLPISTRRTLMAERRRVSRPKPSPPWPSLLEREGNDLLRHWVKAGVRPSRHLAVTSGT